MSNHHPPSVQPSATVIYRRNHYQYRLNGEEKLGTIEVIYKPTLEKKRKRQRNNGKGFFDIVGLFAGYRQLLEN
nr:hypothetical protein CFP56_30339 [Quercus suber]